MNKNYILILGILIVSIISCRTDQTDLIESPDNTGHEPEIFVNATFNGFITDTNGDAIQGALVQIGDSEQITDARGYFKINDLVNGSGAIVKVKANGYIQSVANVLPSSKGIGHIRMNLSTASYQQVISPNGGEDIASDELTIELDPNVSFTSSGNVYGDMILGQVEYFDVAEQSFNRVNHGEICGVSIDDQRVLIEPFNMISFEAEGSAGEALELESVVKASAKVPDQKLSFAPSEIPVWHLDDKTGLWTEAGIGYLVNGFYQFDIDALGRWTCGTFNSYAILSGQANEGVGITNVSIRITNQNRISDSKIVISDNKGHYWAKVPKGNPLIIEVLDECGNVSGLAEVGSLDEDATANINLYQTTVETIQLNGNLICSDQIVADGYAMVQSSNGENYIAEVDDQGDFQIEVLDCGATEFTVMGVNNTNNGIGMPIQYNTNEFIQVENLESCNNGVAYFLTYKFADREIRITNFNVSGSTDFSFLAFDIDFVHETLTDTVTYKISVIEGTAPLEPVPFVVPSINTASATESYFFERKEIQIVDHGSYLEGNAFDVNFTNETTGVTETGSIHFRLEKI